MASTALPNGHPSSGRLPVSSVDRLEIEGIAAIETALVTLSPEFVDALKKVAPKKRPSWARVPLTFALGVLLVVATLGLDRSTRDFVLHRNVAVPVVTAEQAQTAAPSSAPVVAAPSVVRPTVLVDDPTPPPSVERARKTVTKKPAKPLRKLDGHQGASTRKVSAGLFNA
ncbi:MAG TPA: hypothetical protein VIF62_18205 [Labilithrix sp.]